MARALYYVKARTWVHRGRGFSTGRIVWGAWEAIYRESSLRAAIRATKFRTPSFQWAVFYRGKRVGTLGWDGKFYRSPAFKRTRVLSKSRGRKK